MPSSMLLNARALGGKTWALPAQNSFWPYGGTHNPPGTCQILYSFLMKQMSCVTNNDSVKCPYRDTKIIE